jgi:hypothetical protein
MGTPFNAGTFELLDWTGHQPEIGTSSEMNDSNPFNLDDRDAFFLNKKGDSNVFTGYHSATGPNMGSGETEDSGPMLMPVEWAWEGDEDEGFGLGLVQS